MLLHHHNFPTVLKKQKYCFKNRSYEVRKHELFHNKKIKVCSEVRDQSEHSLSRAARKYSHIILLIEPMALHSKTGAGHLEPN